LNPPHHRGASILIPVFPLDENKRVTVAVICFGSESALPMGMVQEGTHAGVLR
jgi:hypothetical protein